jgi:hypothetical protein
MLHKYTASLFGDEMKMEAECSSEMLIHNQKTTQRSSTM